MAPIKFEDNIREKLQERELQPSGDAWNKLESQLGEQEEKNSNRTVWYAIAAAFIGIIVIGSMLLNNRNTAVEDNQLVVEDVEPSVRVERSEVSRTDESSKPEVADVEPSVRVERSEVSRMGRNLKPEVGSLKQGDGSRESSVRVELSEVSRTVGSINSEDLNRNSSIVNQSIVDNKVKEVVAKVQDLQLKNQEVTPEEVDALLLEAQREIQAQKILSTTSGRVDAAALLLDVELELERSFRDKVFDALGDGFQKIRTAVSERNN